MKCQTIIFCWVKKLLCEKVFQSLFLYLFENYAKEIFSKLRECSMVYYKR